MGVVWVSLEARSDTDEDDLRRIEFGNEHQLFLVVEGAPGVSQTEALTTNDHPVLIAACSAL